MQKKWYTTILAGLLLCNMASAQMNAEKVQRYIATYKDLAMAEQQRSGIPAAITLAQGILESGAGESELAVNAANHFGIKCKSTWTGETYNHDDDLKDECFRKYTSAEASFRDHSEFLKSSGRYEPCFAQSTTDYAAWAMQLKKCGYATSPTYPQRLIRVIEEYKLQQYTYAALNTEDPLRNMASAGENVPEKDADMPVAAAPVVVKPREEAVVAQPAQPAKTAGNYVPEKSTGRSANITVEEGVLLKEGRRGFWARRGDVLLEDAIRHRIRYARLLEINGLPDEPLTADRFIYLEKATTNTFVKTDVLRTAGRDESARIASSEPARVETAETPLKAAPIAASAPAPAPKTEPVDAAPQPVAVMENKVIATEEKTNAGDRANKSSAELIAALNAPAAVQNRSVANDDALAAPAEEAPVMMASADNNLAINTGATATETTSAEPEEAAPVALDGRETGVVVAAAGTPAAEGVNIADEVAVEEDEVGAPAEEEPKSELSRLKARFDKAVFAPTSSSGSRKEAAAAAAPAPEPKATPVVAAAAAPQSGPKYYTVQKGETAFSIAKKHGISIKELQALNNMEFAAIKVGQRLRVK